MSRRYGQLDETGGAESVVSAAEATSAKEVKDASTQHDNKLQLTWKEWLFSIPLFASVR
jgi:hypothetical protein